MSIILTILLCLLIYLLFAPVVLEIDTTAGLYRVRYHVLAAAGIMAENDSLTLYIKILPWTVRYDLFELIHAPAHPKQEKHRNRERKSVPFSMIMAAMRSFRIKKLSLAADTGDETLNGMLYPLSAIKQVNVNFAGRNELVLVVTNNAARVLWAITKSSFHRS